MDFGIGITKENQRRLFDGLFHTLDTELYASKRPYDFGAGGKGLDLLRAKVYGQRFKFDVSVGSQRCTGFPPTRISAQEEFLHARTVIGNRRTVYLPVEHILRIFSDRHLLLKL